MVENEEGMETIENSIDNATLGKLELVSPYCDQQVKVV